MAPIKSFSGKLWKNYVDETLKNWEELYTYYIDNYSLHQVHVLRFENLKTNLEVELKNLMEFLDLEFDRYVVECMMKKQNGHFKRPKPDIDLKKFYTKTQRQNIESSRDFVYKKLGIN